jgi:hypothetical protein
MPARIEDGADGSKEYFPAQREELVEDALRKLMTERQGSSQSRRSHERE